MNPEENKALVRRFYEEIDQGNLAAMDELVAEDYVNHHPPPFPGLATGLEGLKQAFEIFWEATPGHHEIEDKIAEGDTADGQGAPHARRGDPSHRRWQARRALVGHRRAGAPATARGHLPSAAGGLALAGVRPVAGQHLGNAPHGDQTNSDAANPA